MNLKGRLPGSLNQPASYVDLTSRSCDTYNRKRAFDPVLAFAVGRQ